MRKIVLFLFSLFIIIKVSGQGHTCDSASFFCAGTNNIYPASVDVPTPSYGTYPNFGCLCTMPNPAYYYMQVASSGNIVIHISTTPSEDVDFICWGPFTSLTNACANGLTGNCTGCNGGCPNNTNQPAFYPSGNITDCSYSVSSTEDCHINNAVTGQFYMLLITNYSNLPCNINFSQTNTGEAGAGSTFCGAFPLPIVYNGPSCVGDTIKLYGDTISGATYSWTGPNSWMSTLQNPIILNATLAMSGNYICNLWIDTTIIVTDTTIITINSNPTITVTSDTVCAGETATLTASGAANYVWGNGMTTNPIQFSPFVSALIPVCGIDTNNCIAFVNATITVSTLPNKPVINQNNNILTSSSVADNQWFLNGQPILGATNQSYTVPSPPTDTSCYSVSVINIYGCSATSDSICFYPLDINEFVKNIEIKIYPNPAEDNLIIETNSNIEQRLEIINLIGQTIYTSNINKKGTINTSTFRSGVYFIKLMTDKETVVRKFVKE